MKKLNYLIVFIFCVANGFSQTVIFEQDFNGADQPADWFTYNYGTGDMSWAFGSEDMPDGDGFSSNAAIFDDNTAGSDHDRVELSHGGVDLTQYQSVSFHFDYIFQEFGEQILSVVIFNPTTEDHIILKTYDEDTQLTTDSISISPFLLQYADDLNLTSVEIGFLYDDIDGSWGWGAGVDNVSLIGYLPPENDDCGGAISLAVQNDMMDFESTSPVLGTISGATDSGVTVSVCEGSTGVVNDDVWFSFTAETEDVHITVEEGFDCVINLFSGGCNGLSQIGCADNLLETIVQIDAGGLTVGDVYYVRVYSWDDYSVVGNFNISVWNEATVIGIEDIVQEGVSVFPNPVKDILTLNAKTAIEYVAVYNMLGQSVKTLSPNAPHVQVNMGDLSAGAYVVKVRTGDKVGSYSVIKE